MTTLDTIEAAGKSPSDEDAPIKAVPLRRPGRWVSASIIVLTGAFLIYGAATNPAYGWPTYAKYLFDQRVSQAVVVTVLLTVISMAIAISLGVVLSIMRESSNPVLQGASWVYLWIFRGTPVYVQLVLWGLLTTIYKHIDIGIPGGPYLFQADLQQIQAAFWLGALGLGLNEAAYMSEIVRAGIRSVGEGQTEAATALGMGWAQTMRRIVLPQAMRVIIPPTGNELIGMLKTTSLVVAVPYGFDLYARTRDIGTPIFDPVPLLLVASTWYLAITSVLMVGQYFLERHFSRGLSRTMSARQLRIQQEETLRATGGTP